MSMLSLLVLRQLRTLAGGTHATAGAPEQACASPSTEPAPHRVADDDASIDADSDEHD